MMSPLITKPAEYAHCQGPPRCELQGIEREQAARQGCPWCRRIYVAPNGSERRIGPPLLGERNDLQ